MSDHTITIPERILALLTLHAAARQQTPDEVAVALLDEALLRPAVDVGRILAEVTRDLGNIATHIQMRAAEAGIAVDLDDKATDLAPALDRAESALLDASGTIGDLRGLAARRAATMAASGSLPAMPLSTPILGPCFKLSAPNPRPPYVGTRTKVDIRLPSAVVAAAVWWADDEDRSPIDLLNGILDAHLDATPEVFPTLPTVPKDASSWIALTLDDGIIMWIEQHVTDGRGADDVLAGIINAHLADRVDAYHVAADKRRADLWDFAGVDISARDGAGNARIHLVRPPGQRSLRLWVDRRHVADITAVVDAIRAEIAEPPRKTTP